MSKKIATLTGLAIGDALGAPFEFLTSEEINTAIKDGRWSGEYLETPIWEDKLNPGQYSDDTKMAIALSESLVENNGFNIEKTAQKYLDWYNSRDLRGIGKQTSRALNRLKAGVDPSKSGLLQTGKAVFSRPGLKFGSDKCGNGTAMRVAPIGLYYRDKFVIHNILESSYKDAIITHNHASAINASYAVAAFTAMLANNIKPEEAISRIISALDYKLIKPEETISNSVILAESLNRNKVTWENAIIGNNSQKTEYEAFSTDGTAHATVGSAIFCFLRYIDDGFKEVVMNAIKMGGDTDTRAAIAGAFAGTYLGLEEIPEDYINQLENKDYILSLDEKLAEGPINE